MPECFRCGTDASVGEVAIWDLPRWIWVWNSWDQWEETKEEWERLPEAIWDRPCLSIEACDIYCQSCWEEWGQHVKPGCKFALNRACEELAVQAGIQFVDNSNGDPNIYVTLCNPFYCPPCHRYFNHGTSSLEWHLMESHGAPLKRGHCLENLVPTLQILSYHDERINGTYVARRWHHDRPLYQKDADGFGKVLIHFWDDRDGEVFQGWWLTFEKLGGEQWAYNPFCRGPDDLTPPAYRWRVPWYGPEVDRTLIIIPQPDGKNAEFGLRWEFVASSNGEAIDWQPMKKAMNDALEKRWAQGWHGDDGTDTFNVIIGDLTYGIDCIAMEQWNAKTNRRRRIRRGEERSDVSALLSKLSEKNARVEWLQTERDDLAGEKNQLRKERDTFREEKDKLTAEVAKLESLGCKQIL